MNINVKEMWESYVAQVIAPAGVKEDSVQYQETRRAFYAGVQGMLGTIAGISALPTEEAGIAVLNSISEELKVFVKAMMEGRA